MDLLWQNMTEENPGSLTWIKTKWLTYKIGLEAPHMNQHKIEHEHKVLVNLFSNIDSICKSFWGQALENQIIKLIMKAGELWQAYHQNAYI